MKNLNENFQKVLRNLLFCIIGGAGIASAVWFHPLSGPWNIYVFGIASLFLFGLATFFGDDNFNVTLSWPEWAVRIKDIVGDIISGNLLFFCFCFIAGLILMLFDPSEVTVIIVLSLLWLAFLCASWFSEKSEQAKKLNDQPRKLVDKITVVVGMNLLLVFTVIQIMNAFDNISKDSPYYTPTRTSRTSEYPFPGYIYQYPQFPLQKKYFHPPSSFKTGDSYTDSIMKVIETPTEEREEILRLSVDLQKVLNISSISEDFEMVVGNYIIYGVSRPQFGWDKILEIRPKNMPKDHGYRNVVQISKNSFEIKEQTIFPPQDWYYNFQGTATEILPPLVVRERILKKIKK